MSQIENLLNPPKATGVRWNMPESTMVVIRHYQKQLWEATGTCPKLEQVVAHMIEYVGKETCDKYLAGLMERKRQEKEMQERESIIQTEKSPLL